MMCKNYFGVVGLSQPERIKSRALAKADHTRQNGCVKPLKMESPMSLSDIPASIKAKEAKRLKEPNHQPGPI